MLRYCTRCVMPSTKPDLGFDEHGVCDACRNYSNRPAIDWEDRKRQLLELLDQYRIEDGSNWDCVVPVSGGKDSTFQILKMLELGMNPLAVTSTTCDLSDLGRQNIENLKSLGVDYIELSANPHVKAIINRIGLTQVGDISWREHISIFTMPIRIAVQMGIKLVVWGENSLNEYGGPARAAETEIKDRAWIEEFGGFHGMRVSDLVGVEGLTARDLIPYRYPSDDELKRVGVKGVFLGHFLPWDGLRNALLSQAHGFTMYNKPVEGSVLPYENLDNHQHGIHDYFKFLKYGFGRATDHVCMQIRRNRFTRAEGIELVKMHDGKFPWSYLGKSLADILEPIGVSVDEFVEICDRFTNTSLFEKDSNGNLIRDRNGNLTKINYDNIG